MISHNAGSRVSSPRHLEGISLNAGVGLGQAIVHQPGKIKAITERSGLGSDAQKNELIRLDEALDHTADEIQALILRQSTSPLSKLQTESQENAREKSLDILKVYGQLANDPGWKRQLREKIHKGASAIAAVDQTLHSIQKKLRSKGKPAIWRERISDFEDISFRLKRHLANADGLSAKKSEKFPVIIIADRIGPAELLDYDRNRVAGLVLAEQSHTSHAAIVARSLGIPVVGGIPSILDEVNPGDSILVDGNEGSVYIRPTQKRIRRFNLEAAPKKTRLCNPPLERGAPSQTLDGVSVSFLLNAGLVEDVDHIEAVGAEGIGLYRTEIPFMMRSTLPSVAEQTKLYGEILRRAGNYPVVFRTLDVGSDKALPYMERPESKHARMEQQATRALLDRPILLRYQIRALIRASGGCELNVMLPMVAEVREVKAARELLNKEMESERARGNPVPVKVRLGAMIEVPSLVFQLPQLFPWVDFLSVGSNDLFQFFYAIDREYPKLSVRYDVLAPTFLNLLKFIRKQCQGAQIPLSICGEMAGRPLEALALIGLGYRSLSMSAATVPAIKNIIRHLACQEISDYVSTACACSKGSIRQSLRHFARDHGISSQ